MAQILFYAHEKQLVPPVQFCHYYVKTGKHMHCYFKMHNLQLHSDTSTSSVYYKSAYSTESE